MSVLSDTLDAAGLRYELRESAAGVTYAGFRAGAGDRLTSFTAIVRGKALQLTAHDLAPAVQDLAALRRLNELNQDSGFGCVYVSARGETYEASVGLLASPPPPPAAVRASLGLLSAAGVALRTHEGWRGGLEELQLATVPPAGTDAAIERVGLALGELGAPFQPRHEGELLALKFVDDAGGGYGLELFTSYERFLHMRVRPGGVPPVDREDWALARAQELNARFAIGVVALWDHPVTPYYLVGLPLAWTTIDAEVVSWLLDRAAATAIAIRHEFAAP